MSALSELGELYRNEEGAEVWRIRDREGNVRHDNISSDHDAAWLADRI